MNIVWTNCNYVSVSVEYTIIINSIQYIRSYVKVTRYIIYDTNKNIKHYPTFNESNTALNYYQTEFVQSVSSSMKMKLIKSQGENCQQHYVSTAIWRTRIADTKKKTGRNHLATPSLHLLASGAPVGVRIVVHLQQHEKMRNEKIRMIDAG